MKVIDAIEAKQKQEGRVSFEVGDTVRLHIKVIEGNKERDQPFQGVVIQKANSGVRATFTLRKVTGGVAVERIFPLHSPNISDIKVVKRGSVRRARLYYLRARSGKAARIRELGLVGKFCACDGAGSSTSKAGISKWEIREELRRKLNMPTTFL